jgi:hypothetical protein
MITNTGKGILAKYLLGQAPAYASYIAVGCGPQALSNEQSGFTPQQKEEYFEKNSLDFEMFRVPIISRGYVNENNAVKLVLTAELPTEERYEITEVGVFSAGANPAVGAFDSRTLYTFGSGEGWEYHTNTGVIAEIQYAFNGGDLDVYIGPEIEGQEDEPNVIAVQEPVFYTNADNRIFTNESRLVKNERCRFLNELVAIAGDYSGIQLNQQSGEITASGNHIHLTDASINLNKNAPSDELRFAFSLINKDGNLEEDPDNVKILIEFSSSDTVESGEHARLLVNIDNDSFNGTAIDSRDFSSNRYFVVAKQLQELSYTSAFNWESVTVIKVYVSVSKNGQTSSDYYVCLDGLRLENLSSNNPLYGLTGYSVIKNNTPPLPIVKAPNTSNFIEFRLSVGVE